MSELARITHTHHKAKVAVAFGMLLSIWIVHDWWAWQRLCASLTNLNEPLAAEYVINRMERELQINEAISAEKPERRWIYRLLFPSYESWKLTAPNRLRSLILEVEERGKEKFLESEAPERARLIEQARLRLMVLHAEAGQMAQLADVAIPSSPASRAIESAYLPEPRIGPSAASAPFEGGWTADMLQARLIEKSSPRHAGAFRSNLRKRYASLLWEKTLARAALPLLAVIGVILLPFALPVYLRAVTNRTVISEDRRIEIWSGLTLGIALLGAYELWMVGAISLNSDLELAKVAFPLALALAGFYARSRLVANSRKATARNWPTWRSTDIGKTLAIGLSAGSLSFFGRIVLENIRWGSEPLVGALVAPMKPPVADTIRVLVSVPVFEELCFRGLIFLALRARFGFWFSATTSAVLFGVAHPGCGWSFASAAWSGLALALAMEAGRGLAPAVIAHSFHNALVEVFNHWTV